VAFLATWFVVDVLYEGMARLAQAARAPRAPKRPSVEDSARP
jgi:hypothetical protein